MSFPLPHVLVPFNLSRRSALRSGEAARRVIHPSIACLLLACLVPSCSLARPASLLVSLLVVRDGFAMRCHLCLRLRRACGCRAAAGCLLLGSLASRLPIAPLLGTVDGEGIGCRRCLLLSDFYRLPFSSACEAGGAAYLFLWSAVGFILLCAVCADFVDRVRCGCRGCFAMIYCHCVVREDEHGIGSSGFLSLVFLTRFSAPSHSYFLPRLDAYSGHGHFQSFHARLLMGPLLSTRLGPFACLIAVDGPRCFSMRIICGELVKTAPTDAMISNRQSNQCPFLVSSFSPLVVS